MKIESRQMLEKYRDHGIPSDLMIKLLRDIREKKSHKAKKFISRIWSARRKKLRKLFKLEAEENAKKTKIEKVKYLFNRNIDQLRDPEDLVFNAVFGLNIGKFSNKYICCKTQSILKKVTHHNIHFHYERNSSFRRIRISDPLMAERLIASGYPFYNCVSRYARLLKSSQDKIKTALKLQRITPGHLIASEFTENNTPREHIEPKNEVISFPESSKIKLEKSRVSKNYILFLDKKIEASRGSEIDAKKFKALKSEFKKILNSYFRLFGSVYDKGITYLWTQDEKIFPIYGKLHTSDLLSNFYEKTFRVSLDEKALFGRIAYLLFFEESFEINEKSRSDLDSPIKRTKKGFDIDGIFYSIIAEEYLEGAFENINLKKKTSRFWFFR